MGSERFTVVITHETDTEYRRVIGVGLIRNRAEDVLIRTVDYLNPGYQVEIVEEELA